uniref:Uncharacterized protein n=1 Tax=Avena sativa TaxID=4498 RepID=A0ACD5XDW3_AVESA
MRRLVFAELVVLAAAGSVALALLVIHCCRRGWSGSKRPPEVLPVPEPRQLPGARKEGPLERLRRVLLRLCSRRSRVEPAAASAATSPDAQVQGEVVVAVQAAAAAGPEEGVAAWRERWFGGPGSRALYTIDEESSSTSSWTPTAVSEGDVESQCGGCDRQAEPETPFYTPPASPLHEAEQLNGGGETS